MNLTISIDDKELEAKISEGLRDLNADDVASLCKMGLAKALSDEDFLKSIIAVKHERCYGNDWWELHPKVLEVLESAISADMVDEYKKKIKDVMDNDCRGLIVDALVKAFTRNLFKGETEALIEEMIRDRIENDRIERNNQ